MTTATTDTETCVHCDLEVSAALAETNPNAEFVCENCAARFYYRCDECGHLFHALLQPEDSCEELCEDCAVEAGYHDCLDCTNLVRDYARCSYCRDRREDSWTSRIHEHDYKPDPVFLGTGPLFLGMELEINAPDHDEQILQLCEDRLGSTAYFKEDDSIRLGFELVTHPMSFDWARANFPWTLLLELAEKGCHGRNLGLHVHVSRDAFTGTSHVFRWMKFIYRNADEVQQLARRHNSSYAEFSRTERAEVIGICKGDRARPRYSAINVQNADTFELRMFASSLDPQEVQAALAFADATVRYAQQLTLRAIARDDGWSWAAFLDWVVGRDEYLALSRECEVLACAC